MAVYHPYTQSREELLTQFDNAKANGQPYLVQFSHVCASRFSIEISEYSRAVDSAEDIVPLLKSKNTHPNHDLRDWLMRVFDTSRDFDFQLHKQKLEHDLSLLPLAVVQEYDAYKKTFNAIADARRIREDYAELPLLQKIAVKLGLAKGPQ